MYMKMYIVADFRKNTKAALDAALDGEDVFIDRNNQIFKVTPVKTKTTYAEVSKSPQVPTLPGQITIDEGIENQKPGVEYQEPESWGA